MEDPAVNPWHTYRRRPTVTNTVPPADVIPRGTVMHETTETVELEQVARIKHAARIVHRTLIAQHLLLPDDRNHELIDVLLDLRSTLMPSAPGSEVLREGPTPVAIGHAVPVIPGRSS